MTDLRTDSTLLSVRNLSVRFATARGNLYALADISLDVSKTRTLALVGESGSGKSVLSRSILRLLPANASTSTAAEILFEGDDLLKLSPGHMRRVRGRKIAMVFQDPMTALNPVRTIGSQLVESMRLHLGLGKQAAEARAISLLEDVGINSPARRMTQYPHELSGGMRQRVVIAIAISCKPDLLIADEPTTALDVTVQADILDLLRRLQRERQMTMILVTHDLGVAATYADDIAVMYAGQIVERSSTRSLFQKTRMPYTSALLRSIPKLGARAHEALFTIPGRPSTVWGEFHGCRFAARCDRKQEKCASDSPSLIQSDEKHSYRCWFPMEVV